MTSRVVTVYRKKTGRSVTKQDTEYYLSTSKTSLTGGQWTTKPTYEKGKYLWERYVSTWSDGTAPTYSEPKMNAYVSMMGTKMTYIGEDGIYTGTLAADTIVGDGFVLGKGTVGGFRVEAQSLRNTEDEVRFGVDGGCAYVYNCRLSTYGMEFVTFSPEVCYIESSEARDQLLNQYYGTWRLKRTVIDAEGTRIYTAKSNGNYTTVKMRATSTMSTISWSLAASYEQDKMSIGTLEIDASGVAFVDNGNAYTMTWKQIYNALSKPVSGGTTPGVLG